MSMIVPLGIVFLIFWVLIWRPQNKQRQEHDNYLSRLAAGDEIVTSGGIIGKIKAIDDTTVTLEVSKGSKLTVLRRSIQGSKEKVLGGNEAEDSKKNDSEDDDKS